jgi:porphobilinogen synthase
MTISQFPTINMRRMRSDAFSRSLVRESHVRSTDLIQPVYLLAGSNQRQPVVSMPGVSRLSLDLALDVTAECLELGIPAVSLQPVVDTVLRSADGSEALNPEGHLPRAITAIKETFPSLGVIAEVGLGPYTAQVHLDLDLNNPIVQQEKQARVAQQSVMLAKAGADFLVLSELVPGQVSAVRAELELEGLVKTRIVAASANYSSASYGPNGDHGEPLSQNSTLRKTQPLLDPANAQEAIHEAAMHLVEGADAVMVKPGMSYLDVIHRIKDRYNAPTFAFQSSGEYAMLKAAAQNGWLIHDRVMLEWAVAFKRAGADAIFTHFARDIARLLKQPA